MGSVQRASWRRCWCLAKQSKPLHSQDGFILPSRRAWLLGASISATSRVLCALTPSLMNVEMRCSRCLLTMRCACSCTEPARRSTFRTRSPRVPSGVAPSCRAFCLAPWLAPQYPVAWPMLSYVLVPQPWRKPPAHHAAVPGPQEGSCCADPPVPGGNCWHGR